MKELDNLKLEIEGKIKMANGFMNKEIVKRIPVDNESYTKRYEICEYDDGSFSCNCPAWIFHKGERVNCKHINNFISFQLTIQKVGNHIKADKKFSQDKS